MAVLKNRRHELFCQGIVQGKPADRAYVDAGYKPGRNNASRLRANENVKRRIAELQQVALQEHNITVDRTLKEYERLAFLDPRELYDDEGRLLLPHKLPADVAAAVAGIDLEQVYNEDTGITTTKAKIKFHNKQPILRDLSQVFGLVEQGGAQGTAISNNTQVNVNVTPREKVRTIAAAFAKVANDGE